MASIMSRSRTCSVTMLQISGTSIDVITRAVAARSPRRRASARASLLTFLAALTSPACPRADTRRHCRSSRRSSSGAISTAPVRRVTASRWTYREEAFSAALAAEETARAAVAAVAAASAWWASAPTAFGGGCSRQRSSMNRSADTMCPLPATRRAMTARWRNVPSSTGASPTDDASCPNTRNRTMMPSLSRDPPDRDSPVSTRFGEDLLDLMTLSPAPRVGRRLDDHSVTNDQTERRLLRRPPDDPVTHAWIVGTGTDRTPRQGAPRRVDYGRLEPTPSLALEPSFSR